MSNDKMAGFIAELRKLNGMTQKELAEKLNVTDKAVSKWERGLSCPDVALLNPLSSILGVTASELLNGEKTSIQVPEVVKVVETTLKYADTINQNKFIKLRYISGAILTILFLIAIITCILCDLAITGKLTWSFYPIFSIVFAWCFLYPVISIKKMGLVLSLIAFSVLLIPYLFSLKWILGGKDLLTTMGIWIALIGIIFLWLVYVIFKVLPSKKIMAAAISVMTAIPSSFLINLVITRFLNEPLVDVWDVLSYSILLALAISLYFIHQGRQGTFHKTK